MSRDNWHKHSKTWGRRKPYHRSEDGSRAAPLPHADPPGRAHCPRARGHKKPCALRLDMGDFWGSECCPHKTRITGVVSNTSNKERVHAQALVKNRVVLTDSTPCPRGTSPTRHCPGPQEGGRADSRGGREFKQKVTKENSEEIRWKGSGRISSLLEEPVQLGERLAHVTAGPGRAAEQVLRAGERGAGVLAGADQARKGR